MLEINTVSWRNFLSWGDYTTTLDIANLGQCLITGEITDEENPSACDISASGSIQRSNGAGKSGMVNVILWTLFGRTMHSAAPGNKILNWYTGKDCWAKIEFKSGDYIIRSRTTSGATELIFVKDGDEHKLTADTVSTVKNQQTQLNKIFRLDWDIFCGSAFFSQYGKPWMEMSDAARKKSFERLLHVDRFSYYTKATKQKIDANDLQMAKHNQRIQSLTDDISRLENEEKKLLASIEQYGITKCERIDALVASIADEQNKADAIDVPDRAKLQASWDAIKQAELKIASSNAKLSELSRSLARSQGTSQQLLEMITDWESKAGAICPSCKQVIDAEHALHHIDPIRAKYQESIKTCEKITSDIRTLDANIKQVQTLLNSKRPAITIGHIQHLEDQRNFHKRQVSNLSKQLESLRAEVSPYESMLESVRSKIEQTKSSLITASKALEHSSVAAKHYQYIYRAYNDRAKIKSFLFGQHIPFINNRLHHYLDMLHLDVKIELTDSLTINSDKWGYEFESGGERMRTNIAVMLATYDFHELMYGRQCNLMVLDEVDGRLDDDGINSLVSIIKEDLAPRVESLIIISHRNQMHDVFDNELKVRRVDRMSYLSL